MIFMKKLSWKREQIADFFVKLHVKKSNASEIVLTSACPIYNL